MIARRRYARQAGLTDRLLRNVHIAKHRLRMVWDSTQRYIINNLQ